MPSRRVNEPTLAATIYDVIGEDGHVHGFVRHAGLAAATRTQQSNSVSVIDMGPPLRASEAMKANAFGTAELTDDEVRKIQVFVDRHESEHRAVQEGGLASWPQAYCIIPHAEPLREDDGRYVRMRFSCAGFVFEAYRKARIRLLDVNALPAVDMDMIRAAYPREARWLDRGRVSGELFGLVGPGPWPVMLCGYLFHALNRDPAAIRNAPYTPGPGDEEFL